jgi:hypothetical protein
VSCWVSKWWSLRLTHHLAIDLQALARDAVRQEEQQHRQQDDQQPVWEQRIEKDTCDLHAERQAMESGLKCSMQSITM